MPRLLVVGHVRPEAMRLLDGRHGLEVEVLAEPTTETVLAAMPRTDAVVLRTSPLTAAMIDAAPGLKVVSRHGVGYDNVDLAALNRRGIPLALAVNSNRVAVAEHAFAMLLELVKHARAFDAAVRAGDWASRNRLVPTELPASRSCCSASAGSGARWRGARGRSTCGCWSTTRCCRRRSRSRPAASRRRTWRPPWRRRTR